jgi:hypothetical protein
MHVPRLTAIVIALQLAAPVFAQEAVGVTVQGETNLNTSFVESLRSAGFAVRIVPKADARYHLLVAQETTIGSAAAAVIVLDAGRDIVASVVRSGRFSGQGALNACAKELAKRLKALGQ